MKLILFSLLLLSINSWGSTQVLESFETDLCTYFPEGPIGKSNVWGDCCIYHDLKYWIGGTHEEQLQSDLKLKECVRKKANAFYAALMFRGVRLGHLSPIKNRYRWGWGWNPDGYFGELNREMLTQARYQIDQSQIKGDLKEKFIKEYLSPQK